MCEFTGGIFIFASGMENGAGVFGGKTNFTSDVIEQKRPKKCKKADDKIKVDQENSVI